MAPDQVLVAHLNAALLGLLLIGILLHRRDRLCRSFCIYAAACLIVNRLVTHEPGTFLTREFWSFKETLYAFLKLAIAVEIGLRTFSQFARARRQFIVLTVIVVTIGALAFILPHKAGDPHWERVSVFTPRGQAGLAVLFAALVVLAVRYRVPLHPFHRGIVSGFAFYLAVYTLALGLIYEQGWVAREWTLFLDRTAYALTVAVWTWAAWRPAPEMTPIRARLQPWAVSSW